MTPKTWSAEDAPDPASVLVEGPWRHRTVSANGARFHVVEAGPDRPDAPLVMLLHGFPQFWWAWRHQLTALADAGYRTVAMDLRGYGASDKPPRGYDTFTLVSDVDGVIRGLGLGPAVVVGHSWGAVLSWAMPTLAPGSVRAVATLGTPHPLHTLTTADVHGLRWIGRTLAYQAPLLPERALRSGDAVAGVLRHRSGPAGLHPDAVERYRQAMRIPSVAHSVLEYYRWIGRSRVRPDGARYVGALRRVITIPTLQLQGDSDPEVSVRRASRSARYARRHRWQVVEGAGHFLAEEAPHTVNAALLDWLQMLD